MIRKIKKYYRRNNGLRGTSRALYNVWRHLGPKVVINRTFNKGKKLSLTDYQYWIENIEAKYPADKVLDMNEDLRLRPKISVLLPVYNVDAVYLRACLDSVLNQYYEHWELCIADDRSTARHVKRILQAYVAKDDRIKVVYREKNGHIAAATNSALAMATGEYIALLDNDDLLAPQALLEVVTFINQYPDADMIYSDEDKISEDGAIREWPAFKPNWSPDVFLTRMYTSHLGVYRTTIAQKIGGMRSEFNGAQDYDFVLRFVEQTDKIYHIAKMLYHWRMIPSSTSMGAERKNYAFAAGVRAKEDMARRRGYRAIQVLYEEKTATQFVFYPEAEDKISILLIVTQQNEIKLAQETLSSIRKRSDWENYEILIGLNASNMTHFFEPQEKLQVYVYQDASIDEIFVQLYAKTTGGFIGLIQPGIVIQTDRWIEFALGQARLAGTGLVGGAVLNVQEYIEETGLIALNAGVKLIKLKRAYSGYHLSDLLKIDHLQFNANYLLMGNRFVVFEKAKVAQVGLDIHNITYAHFTYLLSLKFYLAGFFNVYRSDILVVNRGKDKVAPMLHLHEVFLQTLSEEEQYVLNHDPFYNENFETNNGNFQLRFK